MSTPVARAEPDELVPDSRVAAELGVSAMTLWRYEHDETLNFPIAIVVRNRKFRSRKMLEAWKDGLLAAALKGRHKAVMAPDVPKRKAAS